MQKKWLIQTPINKDIVEQFRSELKVDNVVAELLLQRNISTFKKQKISSVPI